MDLITAVLMRGWYVTWALRDEDPGNAYGSLAGRVWRGMYLAVLEVSSFSEIRPSDEDSAGRDLNAYPVYRSFDVEALDDLILMLQKHNMGFCPTGEDRPQVRRRNVATELTRLALEPRLLQGS